MNTLQEKKKKALLFSSPQALEPEGLMMSNVCQKKKEYFPHKTGFTENACVQMCASTCCVSYRHDPQQVQRDLTF